MEPRRQPLRGKSWRRADYERAVRACVAQARYRVVDVSEARLQAWIKHLAGRR